MKVKLGQAVKMFFGNSSLEMVYFEAISNALDANATEVLIKIKAKSGSKPETLELEISDNGEGFTDARYKKFSNLFDVEEGTHKGLGRLVYLCYFDKVEVVSHFESTKIRTFEFSEDFVEEGSIVKEVQPQESGTKLTMTAYALQKIAKADYLQPDKIKRRILEEFYARFFQYKLSKKDFTIEIVSEIGGSRRKQTIGLDDIPEFKNKPIESKINLIDRVELSFSIRKVDPKDSSLMAAICVDNRTVKVDLISAENLPSGYEMIFLIYSDYFIGKIDAARQNLTISGQELKEIQNIFRKEVAQIIESFIPSIKQRNLSTKKELNVRYPHLAGYFEAQSIGYLARNEILKKAQEEFFKDQRDLLEAQTLTEAQYEKSLDLSSRALTEYVLFRQKTIEKLKNSSAEHSEAELHKLFATMRSLGRFEKGSLQDDLYRNNAWLLDDKYMTYEVVLSDREMSELIEVITDEKTTFDDNRPDMAIVFSNNPNENKPFDVIIVEFKKRGISLEENLKVVTQLEKRARRLMKFYKNQIQRIWFYGIIEMNEEVEMALAGEYTELYSTGKMYYKETSIAISLNPKSTLPIGVFIWDLDAVVKDADARNSTFLNLIRSKFD